MSRWLKITILVLLLLAVGTLVLLQSPWPLERLLTNILTHNLPAATINNLRIKGHRFDGKAYVMDQVSADLSVNGVNYLLHADEARVLYWHTLLGSFQSDFVIKGVYLDSQDLKFSKGEARIAYKPAQDGDWLAEGSALIPMADFQKLGIEDVAFNFSAMAGSIILKEIQAKCLNGNWNGEFVLEYKPDLPYSMDVKFTDIDTKTITEADVGRQLKGIVDGSLRISGDAKSIDSVKMAVNAPDGAYASAELLKVLTSFIQIDTPHLKVVERAIKAKEEHFLEVFSVNVVSKGTEGLISEVDFNSKSTKLNFKATYDIIVDVDLMNLFQSGQRLLDFYKEHLDKK